MKWTFEQKLAWARAYREKGVDGFIRSSKLGTHQWGGSDASIVNMGIGIISRIICQIEMCAQ